MPTSSKDIAKLSEQLNIELSGKHWEVKLAEAINQMLNKDFAKLISILYRVDVSEEKLKLLLKENPGKDAGTIIGHLLIERLIEKEQSKKKNSGDNNETCDEE